MDAKSELKLAEVHARIQAMLADKTLHSMDLWRGDLRAIEKALTERLKLKAKK